VSARIKSIDYFGMMKIEFNETMVLNDSISWINYENTKSLNISWINETNTLISLLPAQKRDQDLNFNKSIIEFSWKTISFDGRILSI
jgi:hypothetical protein